MGAWNPGNFSNDTALDFVFSIASIDDLKHPMDSVVSGSLTCIDADLACEALAAADLLAAMLGRPATDLPVETERLLSKFRMPSKELLSLARAAADGVLETSELADLWNEEDGQAWKDIIGDLIQRLDFDTPYESQKRETIDEGGFVCSVCEEIIPDSAKINVEIGFPDMPEITMGSYFHRSCIEVNFKPPHFSKQGNVMDSLKKQIERYLHSRR